MPVTGCHFSVIVPTYSRPAALTRCLDALAGQSMERSAFEVIVVDDGSPAPVETLVQSYARRMTVRCVRQENAGPASARNTGAEHARGAWLAFTDDDCEPAPDWLAAFAARTREEPAAALAGRVINALESNVYAAASQLLIDYLYAAQAGSAALPAFFTSNNMAVRADMYRSASGFDTSFPLAAGEDRDFWDRWHASGSRAVMAPEALVRHHHPLRLRTFLRQHMNYGRGARHFHLRRAARRAATVQLAPWTFYRDLVRYPGTKLNGWPAVRASTLLLLSQVANVFGYARQRLGGL